MLCDGNRKQAGSYLLGWIGGVSFAAGLGAWMFGVQEGWVSWYEFVSQIWLAPFQLEHGNYALARLASDDWLRTVSLSITTVLSMGMVALIWATRHGKSTDYVSGQVRNSAEHRYGLIAAMGLVLPLIAGPVMWGHYTLLTVPLALFLIFDNVSTAEAKRTPKSSGPVTLAWLGLIGTALVPITVIPNIHGVWVLVSLQLALGVLIVGGGSRVAISSES